MCDILCLTTTAHSPPSRQMELPSLDVSEAFPTLMSDMKALKQVPAAVRTQVMKREWLNAGNEVPGTGTTHFSYLVPGGFVLNATSQSYVSCERAHQCGMHARVLTTCGGLHAPEHVQLGVS